MMRWPLIVFGILSLVMMPQAFAEGDGLPAKVDKPITIDRPAGEYVIVYLTLAPDGEFDGAPRRAMLAFRDGQGASGMIPRDLPAGRYDASTLTFDGKTITGTLRDKLPGVEPGDLLTVAFDLAVAEGKVTGTYKFTPGPKKTKAKFHAELEAGAGKVTGVIHTEAALKKSQAYAEDAAWPMWSGPTEDRLGVDTGVKLLEDFSKGKLVWRSEFNVGGSPGRAGGFTRKWSGATWAPVTGGGSKVVVADGKVYAWRFTPEGDAFAEGVLAKIKEKYGEAPRGEKFRISAADVMACIDAHTGKTLWTTTLHERGANWQEHKINIMGHTPAVADGRVYAIGSTMALYALDANTGELLWERPSKSWLARRDKALENKAMIYMTGGPSLNRSFCDSPIAFDGMVFFNQGGGVAAFDGATGKKLWGASRVLGKDLSPARWQHGEDNYILALNESKLSCFEAKTGKLMWQHAAAGKGQSWGGLTIHGDVVTYMDRGKDDKGQEDDRLVVVDLTPEGAKERWSVKWHHGGKDQYSTYHSPLISHGKLFATGKQWTDCYDLKTGKQLQRIERGAVANAGHLFGVGDRVIGLIDGKHGVARFVFFRITENGFEALPPEAQFVHRHPQTTTYGPYGRYPIVDGRWFIKGGDAIYCYDVRAE